MVTSLDILIVISITNPNIFAAFYTSELATAAPVRKLDLLHLNCIGLHEDAHRNAEANICKINPILCFETTH